MGKEGWNDRRLGYGGREREREREGWSLLSCYELCGWVVQAPSVRERKGVRASVVLVDAWRHPSDTGRLGLQAGE